MTVRATFATVIMEENEMGLKKSNRGAFNFSVAAFAVCAALSSRLVAEEMQSVGANYATEIPTYECQCKNGFYSTITGLITTKKTAICNLVNSCICVPNFHHSMPITTVMQPFQAPLVVLLCGAEGKTSDLLPRLWMGWLAEAGYHVLAFNSTLDPEFISSSGRGVSGNILNEAECSRDIIGAFLNKPGIREQVTQVGIVGMSYGGIQALLIGKLAAENKVDFKIDAIKSFSPPIDMMRSAELIDRWWRDDRSQFPLTQIYYKVGWHKPVQINGKDVPLSETLMRAGVAASFRVSFVDVVEANDKVYGMGIFPKSGADHSLRGDYYVAYGFTRFMYEKTYPYWKDKLGITSYSQLNAVARLTNVVPQEPDYVETYIANDDPLNRPQDFEMLKELSGKSHLTILDGGGHLGYVNSPWTKAKIQGIFKK